MGKTKGVKHAVTSHCDMGHDSIESGCWRELQREAQTVLHFSLFSYQSVAWSQDNIWKEVMPYQNAEGWRKVGQAYIYGVKQFRSWSRMFKGLKRKRLWYHLSSEDLSSWLEQSVWGGQGEGQAEGTGKRQGHDCLCVPRGMCTKWTAPGSLRPSHWHVLHPACIPLVALWSISTESKNGPDNT